MLSIRCRFVSNHRLGITRTNMILAHMIAEVLDDLAMFWWVDVMKLERRIVLESLFSGAQLAAGRRTRTRSFELISLTVRFSVGITLQCWFVDFPGRRSNTHHRSNIET